MQPTHFVWFLGPILECRARNTLSIAGCEPHPIHPLPIFFLKKESTKSNMPLWYIKIWAERYADEDSLAHVLAATLLLLKGQQAAGT